METELIDKLKISGLTKREAHIYLALLQKKEFAASEIASLIPVDRTKIYEIIPRLVSLGFCSEIQKNGKKTYRAVEPKIAFKNLLANYQQELEDVFRKKEQLLVDKINVINELKNKLDNIYSNNVKKSDVIDYIEMITDLGQIRERWADIQKNAKKELLVFSKLPYTQITLANNIETESKIIKRNKIICKGIYEYKGLTDEEINKLLTGIQAYQKIGEEVRIIKELPMKLVICDEKITMLALENRISLKSSITTLIVDHPSLAISLKSVFESYWRNAISIEDFKKLKTI